MPAAHPRPAPHAWAADVPAALRSWLALDYQPIRDLRTGEIVMVEALSRLLLPSGDVVGAGPLIAAVDDADVQDELLCAVLGRVVPQAAVWRRQAPGVRVSVNATADQVDRRWLPLLLDELCARSGVGADAIVIEVVETSRAGDRPTAARRALAARGIRLAVDDFGRGHSTHEQLERLGAQILKIDSGALADLASDSAGRAVVELAVSLARSRDLLLVAEGIETPAQLAVLRDLGCELGQGHLLGRPTHAEGLVLAPLAA